MDAEKNEAFETYWKSIVTPPDDAVNWVDEEARQLHAESQPLLEAMKFEIRKAFFAGWEAHP